MNKKTEKKSAELLAKAGNVVKDSTYTARDGALYYLDTLRKLPGAYVTGTAQAKQSLLSRRITTSSDDIRALGHNMNMAEDKINAVRDWVHLAKKGHWEADEKKDIEYFDQVSDKLEKRAEFLKVDCEYFINSFLSFEKEELKVAFEGRGTDETRSGINESLGQVEHLNEKVRNLAVHISKTEKDIEKFIDNNLSGETEGELKCRYNRTSVQKNRIIRSIRNAGNSVVRSTKNVVTGSYYIVRALIFFIRYFILLPVTIAAKCVVFFKSRQSKGHTDGV